MTTSIDLARQRLRRRARWGCLVPGVLFGLVMVLPFVAVLAVVWPGVLKLTAPLVCAEGFDDTVVARDTYQVQPGESSTTFTLYCMNDRGEVSDEGSLKPMALVAAAVAVIAVAAGAVVLLVLTVRSRIRRPPDDGPLGGAMH